ncbi:MAG: bifunctional diaminohydroxyphosphoribosylaminopyrimidine deaminase/5-amino-6-(5-phosphoribosylamino)uracil reductase RibD [Acidimicrobiales bacterium]
MVINPEPRPIPAHLADGIRLEAVTFKYQGSERPALDGVSLLLPAGATVALVGDNGAGKSTLVKLLSRFYDPDEGSITIDGVDLRDVDVDAWRATSTGSYQDFVRFKLRAGESVGAGDLPAASDEASVARAAVEGGAASFLEGLPDGYATQLGREFEGGADLSEGQWQKVALSRALMRQAPLLVVLDEPTAALDARAEHELFETYAKKAAAARERGGITVLVSHRFSTVRMADLIVVLDRGRVVEQGTHETPHRPRRPLRRDVRAASGALRRHTLKTPRTVSWVVSDHAPPDNTPPDHAPPDNTTPDHKPPDHTTPDHTKPDQIKPEEIDRAFMGEALALGQSVRSLTSPNPWVGCLIVPEGEGPSYEGATGAPGEPHAEAAALALAGEDARGATVYVTLEPCAHQGRTPPCADALIEAGVARVVVATVDPDPKVSGEGLDRLRRAGVEVTLGVRGDEVERSLAPYLKHRRTLRPWVVLKLGATLDGRIAAPDGTSRWITGPQARLNAHQLRAESDAVCVGAGTVAADDPALTVRDLPGRQPLRVVLGKAGPDARVHPALEFEGDLGDLLDDLGRREVLQLLVEGGARVAWAFHNARLVDQYVIYLAPALFGGDDAVPLMSGPGAQSMEGLWRGSFTSMRRLGEDLRLDIEPPAVS